MNEMRRILRHLVYSRWRVRSAFPKRALGAIELAVKESETGHDGELRFALEGALGFRQLWRGITARQRAAEVFSQLRVWDTEHNSGVLIYVQLADRRVEILADRGIDSKVGTATWQRICAGMEQAFRNGRFEEGAIEGVRAIGRVLAEHFPAHDVKPDELPDAPAVL